MTDHVQDELPAAAQRELCEIAVASIRHAFTTGTPLTPALSDVGPRLRAPGATFVTLLDVGGALLGCIGTLDAQRALATDVADHAVQAAFRDPRLPSLDVDQFERMTVEISILSPLERLDVASHTELRAALRPGHHGLLVEAGRQRATFLPSVWEKVTDVEEFCELLWHKAGLRARTWPDEIRCSRYTTQTFHQDRPRAPVTQRSSD